MGTYPKTALAAAGAILISQRTDDFIVDIRDRERGGERGSWWHCCCLRQPFRRALTARGTSIRMTIDKDRSISIVDKVRNASNDQFAHGMK